MTPARLNVLAISGSLRQGSYNTALIQSAKKLAPEGMDITTFDLANLPLFNEDLEATGLPSSVSDLQQAIKAADLVLLATPEYNGGTSGALKNAIDWASRPPSPHAWEQKPVAILGATPGRLGTVGAQRHLRDSLGQLTAIVMTQPRFFLAGAGKVFDQEGNLSDETTEKLLRGFLQKAYDWGQRMRP